MLIKLKLFFSSLLSNDGLFASLLVILIAIASFGLGRQSVMNTGINNSNSTLPAGVVFIAAPVQSPEAIVLEKTEEVLPVGEEVRIAVQELVGSRSGTKYHLLNCPGAKQIKEENKIYFASKELARAAGYTPAANCSGLK